MQPNWMDRIEQTKTRVSEWGKPRLEDLQERQKTLNNDLTAKKQEISDELQSRTKSLSEGLESQKQALKDRRTQLRSKGEEALENGRSALAQAEATVLETARDLLHRAQGPLGDRAAFLKRGEEALSEALVALRAGHHATLPIKDFDSLNVKTATAKLEGLDLGALRTVQTYEESNKARKTLLRAVALRIELAASVETAVPAEA